MKEHPIIFQDAMVRALLAGTKSQTRRAIKPQPVYAGGAWKCADGSTHQATRPSKSILASCPYGVPGDRLTCYHCGHEQNHLGTSPDFGGAERRLHGRVGRPDLQPDEVQRIRSEGVGGLVSAEGPCHGQGLSDDIDVAREQEGHEVSPPPDLHCLSRRTADTDIGGSTQGRGFQQQQARQSLLGNCDRELAGQDGSWPGDCGREAPGVEVLGSGARAYPLGGAARPVQPEACGTCARCGHVLYSGDRVGGSRLWVRETWAAPHAFDHLPPRLIPAGTRFHYRASEDAGGLLWRPSIHMPRWASRILLEVTEVRVQRLWEITEDDAIAEGVEAIPYTGPNAGPNRYSVGDSSVGWANFATAREAYAHLWDQINGAGSWDANPWVWALSFKRVAIAGEDTEAGA